MAYGQTPPSVTHSRFFHKQVSQLSLACRSRVRGSMVPNLAPLSKEAWWNQKIRCGPGCGKIWQRRDYVAQGDGAHRVFLCPYCVRDEDTADEGDLTGLPDDGSALAVTDWGYYDNMLEDNASDSTADEIGSNSGNNNSSKNGDDESGDECDAKEAKGEEAEEVDVDAGQPILPTKRSSPEPIASGSPKDEIEDTPAKKVRKTSNCECELSGSKKPISSSAQSATPTPMVSKLDLEPDGVETQVMGDSRLAA